jgi:hypothetical protein
MNNIKRQAQMTQYHEEDSERKLKRYTRWTETTIVWVPYFK